MCTDLLAKMGANQEERLTLLDVPTSALGGLRHANTMTVSHKRV